MSTLTYEQLTNILQANHGRFIYVPDSEKYHKPEHWPSFKEIAEELFRKKFILDDCDGFVQLNRYILHLWGEESEMVFCRVKSVNEYHLVCHYHGWILDNRFMWPMKKSDLDDYEFISMKDNNNIWREIL